MEIVIIWENANFHITDTMEMIIALNCDGGSRDWRVGHIFLCIAKIGTTEIYSAVSISTSNTDLYEYIRGFLIYFQTLSDVT